MAQTRAKGNNGGMARRPLVQLATLAGATAPLVLFATPAAAAPGPEAAGSGILTVGLASDAWYSGAPACTESPTGCLPAGAPNPYPAKTLHVGVAFGQEESRSYLALDLALLPPSTSVTGGTLRVPVASGEDGSRAPDTASLQACLVTASVDDDVEGSTEEPPAVDCKKATSPGTFVPATAATPAQLTFDLAPFATAWSTGGAAGIALLPAEDTAPTSAWHVAMSAHDRSGAPTTKPSASVSFAAMSAVDSGTSFESFEDTAAPPPAAPQEGLGSSSVSFGAPPVAPAAPELPTTPLAPAVSAPVNQPVATPQLQPQAFAVPGGGFAYPAVFLLPLALAGVAGWLGRALTRDLTPPAS